MFASLILCFALGGDADFDMIGQRVAAVESEVSILKVRLAALEARCTCGAANKSAGIEIVRPDGKPVTLDFVLPTQPGQVSPGTVVVTGAKEVNGFHPLKAALNIATAPIKAVAAVVPHGQHAHRTMNGDIIVHSDANYGSAAAHQGIAYPWPKIATGGQVVSDCPNGVCPTSSSTFQQTTSFQSSGGCPGGVCPTGRRGLFGRRR